MGDFTLGQMAVILGLLVNLLAIGTAIWKMASWTARVTTVLENHQGYHEKHFNHSRDLESRLSRLEGAHLEGS